MSDNHDGSDNRDEDGLTDDERRIHRRYDTSISIDYSNGDNFLFSYIENISEMGIFVRSEEPLPIGTDLDLRFNIEGADPLRLKGVVVWINPMRRDGDNLNPGMGVRFTDLTPALREQVVSLVRTIAYLPEDDSKDMN